MLFSVCLVVCLTSEKLTSLSLILWPSRSMRLRRGCRLPQPTSGLGVASRLRSAHTEWSRRGAGRPGGARYCTNDLDARCRVCSACPGPNAGGMQPLPAQPHSACTRPTSPVHPGCRRAPPEAKGLGPLMFPRFSARLYVRAAWRGQPGRRQEAGGARPRRARALMK